MQRMTGMLIGATFGAVFIFINASGPLVIVARIVGALALAAVIVMWFLAVRRAKQTGVEPAAPGDGAMFGRGFLLVVVIEAVALFGGLRLLSALEVPPQANVAWVAFVVGVHFVALAPVWRSRAIAVPGAILTVLGVAGFVLAAAGAAEWVPFVSGVLSGVTLLAGCITSSWNGLRSQAHL